MKIGIIGGGAMGGALAQGLIESGVIKPEEITISNPHIEKIERFGKQGAIITTSNVEAVEGSDLVVIAVKPWFVKDVIEEIEGSINPDKTEICSLAAGIMPEDLLSMFRFNKPAHLCLAMPNTAMAVKESMTFILPGKGQSEFSEKVFSLVGKVMRIEKRQLPGAMALASCGIAYAMRYVRAACEGGVELGIRASEAQYIMAQTLIGTARLLLQPGAHPETEIDKVTTPGGFTIRGLNAMEEAGFTPAVIAGLKASIPK